MPLSSRDRVLAALARERPDRTPRDFWAEPPAWERLFQHVGHRDEERLLRDLGVDIRHLDAVHPPEREVDGAVQNLWGERYVYQPSPWGPMREDVPGALAGATTFVELQAFPWPSVDDADFSGLAPFCHEHDDCAILYGFADVWQRPALVRGWEGWFVDLVEHPEWCHFLSRTFCDYYLEEYTRAAEATGGRIDLYLVISDLGSQRGPLISPAMFREFVAPYVRAMVERIHHLGGRAMYHSCGDVSPFIADLAALGVDVLDPIQPVSAAMQPKALAAHGGRIAFHGGIDLQHLLSRGTPDDVRREVRRYEETLGAQGGYILSPAHLFQPDVPPKNVVAMYPPTEPRP